MALWRCVLTLWLCFPSQGVHPGVESPPGVTECQGLRVGQHLQRSLGTLDVNSVPCRGSVSRSDVQQLFECPHHLTVAWCCTAFAVAAVVSSPPPCCCLCCLYVVSCCDVRWTQCDLLFCVLSWFWCVCVCLSFSYYRQHYSLNLLVTPPPIPLLPCEIKCLFKFVFCLQH